MDPPRLLGALHLCGGVGHHLDRAQLARLLAHGAVEHVAGRDLSGQSAGVVHRVRR